jgi:(p)ppGpp synthase/HD superfamily hydrolase
MKFTLQIQKAIKFSIKTHDVYQKQKRKGKDISYITHPLTVGIILARVGASDDVVASGILHDTIEDSVPEKKVTKEMIEERFGKKVADIVESVSETDKSLTWEERKKEALEKIDEFSHDSLLVKSADVVSNCSEILDDYARYGDEIFSRFNAPKEKFIGHNIRVMEKIAERWKENPLIEDLAYLEKKLKEMQK